VDRITIPGLQRRDRTTEPPQLLLARRDYDHPEARALLQALHAEQLTRNAEALGLYSDAGYHSIPTYAEARDPEVNRAFGKTIA
jgi:hypothetical protein